MTTKKWRVFGFVVVIGFLLMLVYAIALVADSGNFVLALKHSGIVIGAVIVLLFLAHVVTGWYDPKRNT